MKMDIRQAAEWMGAEVFADGRADLTRMEISGVNTDSRTVGAGQLFFALEGENFDGHEFVGAAFEAGACAAVVNRTRLEQVGEYAGKAILAVSDTLFALGELAAGYRQGLSAKVVGITGSAGKTTTRNILCTVLGSHFRVHQPLKNFNNLIGLPLTVLSCPADARVLVLELGTNRPGEIGRLSQIAKPDIAMITNVGEAHIEGFGSLEGIMKEKASITAGLRGDGVLFLPGDNEGLVEYCKGLGVEVKTLGFEGKFDIRADNAVLAGLGGEFTVEGVRVRVPLAGRANLANGLAAWAVSRELGLSAEQFKDAVLAAKPVDMRGQVLDVGRGTIIADCYNANPASMANGLDLLDRLADQRGGRKVFICGPMLELGEHSETLHRRLAEQIIEAGVELVLAVGEQTRIVYDVIAGSDCGAECYFFTETAEVADILNQFVKGDDIILVKGSRAARLEKAVAVLERILAQSL